MAGVGLLASLEKQKAVVQESVQAPRKVMLTVQDLRELKNVKIRHVQIHFLEESGNVAAKNL